VFNVFVAATPVKKTGIVIYFSALAALIFFHHFISGASFNPQPFFS